MLYLGKNRGRNCYTIYEKEKHKDIEIHKIANNEIYTNMHNLKCNMEEEKGFANKLQRVLPRLIENLQIHDLSYVLPDNDG